MAKYKSKKRPTKKRLKISVAERVTLVHKADNTPVARRDTIPRIQGRPPASVAPVFRLKVRKKQ